MLTPGQSDKKLDKSCDAYHDACWLLIALTCPTNRSTL